MLKPSGFRGFFRIAAVVLAVGMALPLVAGTSSRDRFDKVRQAPSVEFLDGNALDLLVGNRESPSNADDLLSEKKSPPGEPQSGTALTDLLVDGQVDSDLESVTWSDAEGDPTGATGALKDDLDTTEDILNLEDLEPPKGEPTEPAEAAPAAKVCPNGD